MTDPIDIAALRELGSPQHIDSTENFTDWSNRMEHVRRVIVDAEGQQWCVAHDQPVMQYDAYAYCSLIELDPACEIHSAVVLVVTK